MRGILLATFLALVPAITGAQDNTFLKTAPDTKSEAWWLRTKYRAFNLDVRGIPVAKIRANWCKATEFRKELFPPDLAAYFGDEKSPFAVDGFFDGSRTKQTALVGVYETCKTKRGAFFLILAWPTGKPPVILFVREIPGEGEFATVSVDSDSMISVYHCMECDHRSKFKWSQSKRRFVLLPPDDFE
jgi:hypothetical protein